MYRFEAYFIRASFLYLVYTGLLGTAFYLWPTLVAYFRSSHVHAGTVGFFLSMVMGVAYWMMPRPGQLRQDRLEAWTFALLNTGLVARLVLEPIYLAGGPAGLRPLLALSAGLQLGAMIVFAYAMSQRVFTSEGLRRLRELREGRQ